MGIQTLPILAITKEWVIYALPHQKKLIEEANKNLERQKNFRKQIRERQMKMDFTEAGRLCKEGAKARRPNWEKDDAFASDWELMNSRVCDQ
jgi:hypothetical protein